MISYFKGQLINSNTITINENWLQGIGIFETIKFNNNQMLFFDEHMDRLFANHFFDLHKLNKDKIYLNAQKVIDNNNINEGLIKIIVCPVSECWSDVEYYIFIRELPIINTPFVKIVFYQEKLYPILRFNPMYKSLSYMGNFMAQKDAKAEGAFEPIFYNQDNFITEGAIRNIFFIRDQIIYTPSTDLGILNGITRQKIIRLAWLRGYKVETSPINFETINNMDEAFITSSAIGVLPCQWNGWKSDFNITQKLKNDYKHLIENQ